CREWLSRYDGPQWFNLGDRDLATHLYRTEGLASGLTLSEITERIRRSLGVGSPILPMSDQYAPTWIVSDEGPMHLQEYFVRRRCEPAVKAIEYRNVDGSRPAPSVVESITNADIVVICPSNPFISIGPILAVPGIREAISNTSATVIAITPIIGGRAIKGPAAKMMNDLGHEVSAAGVARLYQDLTDVFVLDSTDADLVLEISTLGPKVITANTIMNTLTDKQRVARVVLAAADEEASSTLV
ncbi:MAG TPA: 2-phospho-L-lactate transferase CofD family protein, partial [Blastocatellia bacterium]